MLCKVLVVNDRDFSAICEPRHPSRNNMIQIKGDGAVGNSFVAGPTYRYCEIEKNHICYYAHIAVWPAEIQPQRLQVFFQFFEQPVARSEPTNQKYALLNL